VQEGIDHMHDLGVNAHGLDPDQVTAALGEGLEEGKKRKAENAKLDHRALENTKPRRGLVCIRASDVVPKKYDWIWSGRIARGKHTTVAGDPGLGKSQIAIAIAATVSTGSHWPCDEGRAPLGNVIILSAEDGIDDTLVPRLIAAGADRERVHIIEATREEDGKKRTFNLQADLDLLEREITRIGDVALVIVDPISSYLGGKVDSHKNAETRAVLTPFGELAERLRVAVLTITHLNKAGGGASIKALYRVIGTIAFTAAPRAVFLVIEDPEDTNRCLFLHGKNNIAKAPQGLALRKLQTMVGDGADIPTSFIEWDPIPVSTTADGAMNTVGDGDLTAKDDAVGFLRVVLAAGSVAVSDLEADARDAGLLKPDQPISQSKPFRSARKALGIEPVKSKGSLRGGWVWSLPNMP
jgi:putative DNA primase/helicase